MSRKKPAKSEAASKSNKSCSLCHFIFAEDASPRRDYLASKDGTFRCRDKASCRARVLNVELGKEVNPHKPAEWLWARYPRDRVYEEMDIRPQNAKALGWMPRGAGERRVFAAILYCSWCYPVCMSYAVQIAHLCPLAGRVDEEPDEILTDRYRNPIPLRQLDIARILNEKQPNVARYMKRLVLSKEIRVDEDGVISIAPVLAGMTVSERRALYAQEIAEIDKRLRGVPKRWRGVLTRISAECPEDIRTDIFETVTKAVQGFNDGLKDIRTELATRVREACSRAGHLIPDWDKAERPSSSPASRSTPSQSNGRASVDVGGPSLNELYDAGLGKGAIAKLPPREERPAALAARLTQILGAPDQPALDELLRACRTVAPDSTEDEILWVVDRKAKSAAAADNPAGLLIKAVPRSLAGSGLAQIREHLRDRQQTAAAGLLDTAPNPERDRIIARNLLDSDETSEDLRRWARDVLGEFE